MAGHTYLQVGEMHLSAHASSRDGCTAVWNTRYTTWCTAVCTSKSGFGVAHRDNGTFTVCLETFHMTSPTSAKRLILSISEYQYNRKEHGTKNENGKYQRVMRHFFILFIYIFVVPVVCKEECCKDVSLLNCGWSLKDGFLPSETEYVIK